MNLRKITLIYMGWCPGVKSAAQFIPDKDIPNKRLRQVSYVGGLIFLLYLIYHVVATPRSYAWDVGFENARYDEIYEMYVKEVEGVFNGIYSLKMWAEAPENNHMLIILYQVGNKNYPRYIFRYRDGMFYDAGQPLTCYGTQYEGEWDLDRHYVWRAYSESKNAVFHIIVDFSRSESSSLGGRPGAHVQINPLLTLLVVLLFLGPTFAIIDKLSYWWDRRQRRIHS
jgi:hypothetical protein